LYITYFLIILIIAGCAPQIKEPPKVYTIESLLTEYDAEIKDWSNGAYLVKCHIGLEKNYSDNFLFFRSKNLLYGQLMLAVNEDGTTESSAYRIDPEESPSVSITNFLKIDSIEALRIFYDDEAVQNQLRNKSPFRLEYEYIKPECNKPVWILVLHDSLHNSTWFYLDPDSLTVWQNVDYLKSEAYQEICGE